MRKALYILGKLEDGDVNWLGTNGVSQHLKAGTVIVRQGEPVDWLFIVIDGQLLVFSGTFEIAKLAAGEVVGEISFVDSRPPSASVRAAVDSQVLAINKELLSGKLLKDPGFSSRFYLALAIFLADRLRVTTSRLTAARKGQDAGPQEDLDELDPEMLENIALASARFDMMVKRLASKSPKG